MGSPLLLTCSQALSKDPYPPVSGAEQAYRFKYTRAHLYLGIIQFLMPSPSV